MPELSYPFEADNANGGSQAVSQTQWQQMAVNWSGDRVDYPLTATTYAAATLPFLSSVSGRVATINAGSAWVGGFYYKLTGTKQFTIADNTASKARKDLIVLRADMAKAAVNMAVVQGTPATTPVEPTPTRLTGSVWEMALFAVDVPANNGTITLSRRAPHPLPSPSAYPWNAASSAAQLPRGAFSVDLDNDGGGVQQEAFNSRDGYVPTRDFSKSLTYTPSALYVSSLPAANRRGRWRWIAPNVFFFSITIVNDYEDQGAMVTGSNTAAAVTLPVPSNSKMVQTVHGMMKNPYKSGNWPNMLSVTGATQPGSSTLYLYYPNFNTLSEGLDGLRGFPARSTFHISGTFEANVFNE
ncbi:hypothetical protein ACWD25_30980 [Streptomyces sp. NPDC002920]